METETFEHRIMVPPELSGELLSWVAPSGEYTIEDTIVRMKIGNEGKKYNHVAALAAQPIAPL